MRMIEIGEDEEIIYPDEFEQETAIPIHVPEAVPVELPWVVPATTEA